MAINACLVFSLWISCLVATSYAATFSSLQRTLVLTASPQSGQVLKAGEDEITVTWSLNTTFESRIDSTWMVQKDVPSATYFVRAYALDSSHKEVAFGQTTDSEKTTNLFEVQAITGRHVSLDIASVCFSGFSVVSLLGFFFMEKRKGKASQSNSQCFDHL